MGNYIRRVKIDSLFEDNNNLKIDFIERTNCIFGENGTGKTTIINLIVAILKCDLKSISKIPFKHVEIMTASRGTKRPRKAICITKGSDNVLYEIMNKNLKRNFVGPIDTNTNIKKRENIIEGLEDILQLTYVPLNRLNYDDSSRGIPDEYYLNRALRARNLQSEEILDIIDPGRRMLSSIEKEFKERYSDIQNKIAEDSASMKNDIVKKTLIDDEFLKQADLFSSKIHSNKNMGSKKYDPKEIMRKFAQANIEISHKRLETHFSLWDKVTSEFEAARINYDDKDRKSISEYSAKFYRKFSMIVLFENFLSIISDIEKLEKNKSHYLKLFNDTEKVINEFFKPRKSFEFDSKGGFLVTSKDKVVEISNLSSGEKHLIALLGRVSLLSEDASVFMADEPELSLHLEWQRPLINSMRKLSPRLQIIVATHSPAIIPADSNQIDLEDCRA